jgi:general secretion pathway protein A
MYDNVYQLKRDPFTDTPDPEFLFVSPSHKAALQALIRGIEAGQELLAVFGAPGLGKTTVLRACQASIQPRFRPIFLGYPKLSFKEILAFMCQECRLDCTPDNPATMFLHLCQTLQEEHRNGSSVVLLIDEAHQLPVQTLESLLHLLALQTCLGEKLFQIVLAGLPTLRRQFSLPQLRPLRERLTVHATLLPLTSEESLAYICHRLTKVLVSEAELFTPGALKLIIHSARGNPRALNMLCSNTLITGSLYRQKPISVLVAREVMANFGTKSARSYLRWGGVAAAGLLLVAGLWWGWQSHWLDNTKSSALGPAYRTQLISNMFHSPNAEQSLEVSAFPTREELVASPPQSAPEHKLPSEASPVPILPPLQVSESVLPQGPVTVEPKGRRSSHTPKQEVPKASVVQQPKPRPVVPSMGTSVGQNRGPVEMVAPVGQSSTDARRREATRQATKAPPGLPKPESTPPDAFMSESQSSPPSTTPREYVGATPDRDREITPAGTDRAASPPMKQTVHFHSFPDAATVLIDGKSIGITPVTVELPMGSHSILVEKSGQTSIRYQLKIDRDGENNLYHDLHADIRRR